MTNFMVGFFISLIFNNAYNNGLIHTKPTRIWHRLRRRQTCDERQWIRWVGYALPLLAVLPWAMYLLLHLVWPEFLYSDMNVDH